MLRPSLRGHERAGNEQQNVQRRYAHRGFRFVGVERRPWKKEGINWIGMVRAPPRWHVTTRGRNWAVADRARPDAAVRRISRQRTTRKERGNAARSPASRT